MRLIVDIIEVVKVVVDLDRSQLSFIDNVLVAQRADIEPPLEPNFMRTLFAEDIELPFKMFFVEIARTFGMIAGTVGGFENHDRLKDTRFLGKGGRSKNVAVTRDFAPTEDSQTKLFGDRFKYRLAFCSDLGVGAEEDIANSVLPR